MRIADPMRADELNERALVAHIASLLAKQGGTIIEGAGEDDCAVLDMGSEEYLLITTDMLHRKTDFPAQMTGRQIGWMSAAVNLSDIAAKGGRPIGIVMAMGIPRDTELAFIEEIVRGMQECATRYGTQIVGGDTDLHDELTLTGTALGLVNRDLIIRRKGAKAGDLVCVTGHVGTAGAALHALKRKRSVSEEVMKALFEPVPRIHDGIALAETRSISSMMDMSDGLALSLYDLSKASGVGFKIYEDRLPILPGVKELFPGDTSLEAALYEGGDFELLFTVSQDSIEMVKKACPLTVIGEVIKDGVVIEMAGRLEKVKAKGYEHFGKQV